MSAMVHTALIAESGTAAEDALSRWSQPADNFPGARRRSLVARALLRGMLIRVTGGPATGWTFGAEPSGRPIAHNAGYGSIPSISLSHSGGWVAVALSYAGTVGIDVEIHRPSRNFIEIAAAAFGSDEQRRVAVEGALGFYRIWTLREAMAKASGVGIAEVADSVDRVAEGPKEGFWQVMISGTAWWLAHTTPVSGLGVAVALKRHPATRATTCSGSCNSDSSTVRSGLVRNKHISTRIGYRRSL